ncbi:DUF4244 domain-containing protein [Actinopolyspora erythraea]|uniref:DUF4244 domain-containing protein n=2 Tax=Actinopolyspora erythraea TaxID=414996 RepID=A0A223RXZ1_9ACTN|nr:DUF4244 domain-containing protein [Actinopolyspora erythraea]
MTLFRLPHRRARAVLRDVLLPRARRVLEGDSGMSTAEYALGTLAAAAFASVLYMVVTSDFVTEALTSLLREALSGQAR